MQELRDQNRFESDEEANTRSVLGLCCWSATAVARASAAWFARAPKFRPMPSLHPSLSHPCAMTAASFLRAPRVVLAHLDCQRQVLTSALALPPFIAKSSLVALPVSFGSSFTRFPLLAACQTLLQLHQEARFSHTARIDLVYMALARISILSSSSQSTLTGKTSSNSSSLCFARWTA